MTVPDLSISALPVVEFGKVDSDQQCDGGQRPVNVAAVVAGNVQLVVGFPGQQRQQFPEEQTKPTVYQDFEAHKRTQMGVELDAPVEVENRITGYVAYARVRHHKPCA